jgi:hypothetical protein
MRNEISWKTCFFVFLTLIIVSPSQALYVKKVVIGEFNNPVGWDKTYEPGNIFKKLLTQELSVNKRIQLVTVSGNMKGNRDNPSMMGNPAKLYENDNSESDFFDFGNNASPKFLFIQGMGGGMDSMNKMDSMPEAMEMKPMWPTKMGRETQNPSMTKIRGTVLKFEPDKNKMNSANSKGLDSLKREVAEVQVHIELVQNKTDRILFKKTFKAVSKLGKRPFSNEEIKNGVGNGNSEFSSMYYAVDRLKREISQFIATKLDSILLEGEVIAINKIEFKKQNSQKIESEEEILVNLGKANGVRIGDLFEVHSISLGLHDPFSGNDLGDIYVRAGVIKVLYAWEGFSKATSLGGMNFKKGFLVRLINSFGKDNNSSEAKNLIGKEEVKIPWWEFHGIRAVN